MFAKHSNAAFLELSNDLQDEMDWVIGHLRTLDVPLNITAFAIEPATKLLAVGKAHSLCGAVRSLTILPQGRLQDPSSFMEGQGST